VSTVVVCDTEPIAIEGLRCLLEIHNGPRIVATQTAIEESVEVVRELRPSLLVVDRGFGAHVVMDWLRINSASNPNARAILSRNPGIGPDNAARWQYVGFKGGSEPGVISMTLLLQSKAGKWQVLSGTWNNPSAGLDEGRFIGLLTRAAELAAQAK